MLEMDWEGASGRIEIMLTLKNSCLSDAAIRTYKHFYSVSRLILNPKSGIETWKTRSEASFRFLINCEVNDICNTNKDKRRTEEDNYVKT